MTKELEIVNPRQWPFNCEVTLTVQENMDGDYPDGDIDLIVDDGDDCVLIIINKDQARQLKDWLETQING